MTAPRGLFTWDRDPAMCELSRRWIIRAGLEDFVEIAEGTSLDDRSIASARKYLNGAPELIVLDSSHEYESTLAELDLWYAALAPGGLLVLHDVSQFAGGFDVTGEGGVRRAFTEWRPIHPDAETLSLHSDSRSMAAATPLYQ